MRPCAEFAIVDGMCLPVAGFGIQAAPMRCLRISALFVFDFVLFAMAVSFFFFFFFSEAFSTSRT